ncbi:uncharacterized protein LOC124819285 isoform X2 [Hydra vulgaris]|uniref:uncharacterized protein LOC124819285 isoform X2 n=1 Tax=Hydra vulgaris TaxID=6087 RepID=UPI0032E9E87D
MLTLFYRLFYIFLSIYLSLVSGGSIAASFVSNENAPKRTAASLQQLLQYHNRLPKAVKQVGFPIQDIGAKIEHH